MAFNRIRTGAIALMAGGVLASGVALTQPATAVSSGTVTAVVLEQLAAPTCAGVRLRYTVDAFGTTNDGSAQDLFAVLAVDGDGDLVGAAMHAVGVNELVHEPHPMPFVDVGDGVVEPLDNSHLFLRLADIAMAVGPGDDMSVVFEHAMAQPVLSEDEFDMRVAPQCASLPFGPAMPETGPPPVDPSMQPVCNGFELNPFVDLDPLGVHSPNVACAAVHDVVNGGPGGRPANEFGPSLPTTRAQLATLVANLLTGAGVALPTAAPDAFADDGTSVHQSSINQLVVMGVIGGNGEEGSSFFPIVLLPATRWRRSSSRPTSPSPASRCPPARTRSSTTRATRPRPRSMRWPRPVSSSARLPVCTTRTRRSPVSRSPRSS